MTEDDPITAVAKATEEIAKTTSKGIDAASGLGRFFDRIFGPALDELGGSLAEKARYWRRTRLLRLEARYEAACAEFGPDRVTKPVEPKFAFALLEAASLENDDDLQDMFAALLANATTEGTGVDDRRAYVSILQEFAPLDAKLLWMICNAPDEDALIFTGDLPHSYIDKKDEQRRRDSIWPAPDVERALWNLVRLGCIQPVSGFGGWPSVVTVLMTALGKGLIESCTIQPAAEWSEIRRRSLWPPLGVAPTRRT